MYYRRKIILALLEQFGGELEKISLQKLLFIFSRRQEKPVYDYEVQFFNEPVFCLNFIARYDRSGRDAIYGVSFFQRKNYYR